MTTIFISYSRKDGDFVRRLHEALGAQDHQTWVDWEGIAPTAEWMKEITAAIDATSAFAFVMTPSSLASSVCAQELEHATAQKKRLIPILRQDIEGTSSPESLAKLNWIFFRDSDDFDKSVQTLISAIDTDLDWVHAHSRLLVRAREWDSKRRENSLALRGEDLKAAEQWLTLGPTRQPAPTELQTIYILESRKMATKRRYRLLSATILGLMAVVILAATTYLGRREASRQQTLALAGRLTADADLAREQTGPVPGEVGWVESSVQLATEAARQLEALSVRSLQTDLAMRRGLALFPSRVAKLEKSSAASIKAVAFDAEGTLIAATQDAFSIEAWSLKTGNRTKFKPPAGSISAVVFSPDARFFATTGLDHVAGVVDVWDVSTLERVASITGLGGNISELAISSSGEYLAAVTETFDKLTEKWQENPTRIWALADHAYSEIAQLPHASMVSFGSHENWLAALVDKSPKVWRIVKAPDVSVEEIKSALPQSNAVAIQFSSDGKYLVASFANGEVQILTVGNWQVARQSQWNGIPLAVSPGAKYVGVKKDDYTASVFDTSSGDEVARIYAKNLIETLSFRPDAQELAIAGLASTVEVWRIGESATDAATISPGNELVAAAFTTEDALTVISPAANQLSATSWLVQGGTNSHFTINNPGGLAVFSPNGRVIALAAAHKATILI